MPRNYLAKEGTLSGRIKAARRALALSQSQAAKAWGFSKRTLEAWEQGVKSPARLYREKLERVLRRIEGQKG